MTKFPRLYREIHSYKQKYKSCIHTTTRKKNWNRERERGSVLNKPKKSKFPDEKWTDGSRIAQNSIKGNDQSTKTTKTNMLGMNWNLKTGYRTEKRFHYSYNIPVENWTKKDCCWSWKQGCLIASIMFLKGWIFFVLTKTVRICFTNFFVMSAAVVDMDIFFIHTCFPPKL